MNERRILLKDEQDSGGGRGIISGYEYVDLGLPSGILWATCDVNASSETEPGTFHKYGRGKTVAVQGNNTWYGGTENPLDLSKDTARQVMGGGWKMPTKEQFEELIANTTYEFVTNFNESGVNGAKFTTSNGNYIFFIAYGGLYDSNYQNQDHGVTRWTSTPYDSNEAYEFGVYDDFIHNYIPQYNTTPMVIHGGRRSYAYLIRGVHEPF